MNNLRDIIKRYSITPDRYTIKKNATIISSNDGHFVFKKRKNNNDNLFKYLRSRSFSYFPNLIDQDEYYDIYEYVEDIDTPREQKALDLMHLLSMLHYKTTYYRNIDIDENKALYESIIKEIDNIYKYYEDLIEEIEESIYMSPSNYLIARNINKIFSSLYYARNELDKWYELVKDKQKKRVVTTHNNLDIDHLIKNDNYYLISWDNSKIDMPIYDLLFFYKKYALEFNFEELFYIYENKYKILEEERLLLFILMSIPNIINYKDKEIDTCVEVRNNLDYIYKTEMLITPNYTPNNKEKSTEFNSQQKDIDT